MLLEERNRKGFLLLLEEQPELFVPYKEELIEWCKGLPEDNNKISDAIISWCKSHPLILEALISLLKNDKRLSSSKQKIPGSGNEPPPPSDPKIYIEMLENNIRVLPSPSDKNNPPENSNK